MSYIIATLLWFLSLLFLAIFSYINQDDFPGTGVTATNASLAAVFTSVYLFFMFLVWLFQRRVNP
ncbi:hypothetical protein [Brevibacillus choshinensis]|uniref:Uncharacterized protein n=1 Tax=Brevibacillus choshinensis TaxID=54911 RepID=A0ABX7FV73_BRECH|nr:hypothetical protein [Brevibacillus choshinensis]QRG70097.1 hypothetical protein JNE38_13840 [Brevibacillus choshinensis]